MARRLAAIGLLFLGCSLASGASADPIYGCQNDANGRISKIGTTAPKCGKKQTLISWDTSAAPTRLFTDGQPTASSQLLCSQNTCHTTLVSLSLPAGSYLLLSNLTVSGDGNLVFCYLIPGDNLIPNVTSPWATAAAQPQSGGYVPMSLQAPISLAAASSVSLSCAANGTASYGLNWQLSALSLSQIN